MYYRIWFTRIITYLRTARNKIFPRCGISCWKIIISLRQYLRQINALSKQNSKNFFDFESSSISLKVVSHSSNISVNFYTSSLYNEIFEQYTARLSFARCRKSLQWFIRNMARVPYCKSLPLRDCEGFFFFDKSRSRARHREAITHRGAYT